MTATAAYTWPCECRPHSALVTTGAVRDLTLLHGADCTRPVEERATVTLRFPRGQEAGQVGSERSPRVPVRPAGWPDRPSSGPVAGVPLRRPGRGASSAAVGSPVPRKSITPTGLVPEFVAQGPVGDDTTTGA